MPVTDFNIPDEVYERLSNELTSADSPVGIDAKKTHIIILHKLLQIEERLANIERELQIGNKYNV